jgi:putative transposase
MRPAVTARRRPGTAKGCKPPAPEPWLTNGKGHGEVETATRFPLLHTPDCDYRSTKIAAPH